MLFHIQTKPTAKLWFDDWHTDGPRYGLRQPRRDNPVRIVRVAPAGSQRPVQHVLHSAARPERRADRRLAGHREAGRLEEEQLQELETQQGSEQAIFSF